MFRFKIFCFILKKRISIYGLLQTENITSARCLWVVVSKLLAARKANFLSLLMLAKKLQCSACSPMLAKTIRQHLFLERLIVEYATVAWSPHTNKGIDCMESVQCRAACFVDSNYSRYSSISSMLTDLNWPSLQSRHRICDLGIIVL